MPLINWEINLMLTWSSTSTGTGIFAITDTKLYVPTVTLSTQDNAKLLYNNYKIWFQKNN